MNNNNWFEWFLRSSIEKVRVASFGVFAEGKQYKICFSALMALAED